MPVVREPVSISQLAELVGVEPWRVIDVEIDLRNSSAVLVLEPAERDPKTLHTAGKVT